MKKVLSIVSAGLLAVLAISCAKDEKVTFKASEVTAPVIGDVTVGTDVTVNYTPAAFNMSFNEKMPVYHTLGLISVNDSPCDVTLSSARDEGTSLKISGKNLTAALLNRGLSYGDNADLEIVVRGTIQDPSKGVTNGYVDSQPKTISWTLKEEEQGSSNLPALEGFGFFVDNSDAPTYAEMALYAWGDGLSDANDLFGSWPGMQPTGTVDLGGTTFVYFDLGAKTKDLTVNFIINNNGKGAQLENFDCFKGQKIERNFFFKITDDNVEEIDEPAGGGASLPDVDLSGYSINDAMGGANTWGLIGPAQPGGWDVDTDLEKVSDDPEIWCVKDIELAGDKFKFRGNDEWKDYDLGGGTVALDTIIELSKGGGDMSIEAGTYTVYLFPTYMVCYITK